MLIGSSFVSKQFRNASISTSTEVFAKESILSGVNVLQSELEYVNDLD